MPFSTVSELAVSASIVGTAEDCARIHSAEENLICCDRFFAKSCIKQSLKVLGSVVVINPLETRRSAEGISVRTWFSLTAHKPKHFFRGTYNSSGD